jgi:hypothetical protein
MFSSPCLDFSLTIELDEVQFDHTDLWFHASEILLPFSVLPRNLAPFPRFLNLLAAPPKGFIPQEPTGAGLLLILFPPSQSARLKP